MGDIPMAWAWQRLAEIGTNLAMGSLNLVVTIITHNPEPDLSRGSWFIGQYSIMMQLALYLCVPFVLIALVNALLKGGMAQLIRTTVVGIPIAALGGAAAVVLIEVFQRIVDAMCAVVLDDLQRDTAVYYAMLTGVMQGLNFPMMFIHFIVYSFIALFCLFIAVEMLFRLIGIYVATLFLPLALAAYIWEATRGWFVRLVEIVAVLILSKFVITVTLAFAFAIIRNYLTDIITDPWQTIGVSMVAFVAVFFATFASPVLLAMVLSPQFEDEATRAKFGQASPLNADRAASRKIAKNTVKKAFKK